MQLLSPVVTTKVATRLERECYAIAKEGFDYTEHDYTGSCCRRCAAPRGVAAPCRP